MSSQIVRICVAARSGEKRFFTDASFAKGALRSVSTVPGWIAMTVARREPRPSSSEAHFVNMFCAAFEAR